MVQAVGFNPFQVKAIPCGICGGAGVAVTVFFSEFFGVNVSVSFRQYCTRIFYDVLLLPVQSGRAWGHSRGHRFFGILGDKSI